jgi:hypothetical protein
MMIFRNSSFLPLLFAIIAVVIVINPVVYGQNITLVPIEEYQGFNCRPAVGEYATCESTGEIWNTKSYCMDSETSLNVLGCCPADQLESWDDSVESCIHGSVGWPTISTANTDATITEEDIENGLGIGSDSTATDSSSSSSLLLSSAMGIAITFVVMIGLK